MFAFGRANRSFSRVKRLKSLHLQLQIPKAWHLQRAFHARHTLPELQAMNHVRRVEAVAHVLQVELVHVLPVPHLPHVTRNVSDPLSAVHTGRRTAAQLDFSCESSYLGFSLAYRLLFMASRLLFMVNM